MILTSCPNSAINRLFSKQNILITDYGQEVRLRGDSGRIKEPYAIPELISVPTFCCPPKLTL
jgi:diphthamide synthase subunit DPH2